MNKQLAIRAMRLSAVLIAEVLTLLGCGQSTQGLRQLEAQSSTEWTCNRAFTPVLNNDYSGFSSPESRIIDNASDWCQVWDTFFRGLSPMPPCDTTLVNFSNEVAILVAIGQVSSGGINPQITCVQTGDNPNQIQVLVTVSSPGGGCDVTASITSPATVVKVQRPVRTAVFKWEDIVHDCKP